MGKKTSEENKPKLLAIEAARIFDAEVSALIGVFASSNYQWRVLSNDPMWKKPSFPTKKMIMDEIESFNPTFIHFALHGSNEGLILQPEKDFATLTWSEIETMPCWKDSVIIAGSCGILSHADVFLKAGAYAVVAPNGEIKWDRLCHFFRIFYSNIIHSDQTLSEALETTSQHGNKYYIEYLMSFGIIGNKDWALDRKI